MCPDFLWKCGPIYLETVFRSRREMCNRFSWERCGRFFSDVLLFPDSPRVLDLQVPPDRQVPSKRSYVYFFSSFCFLWILRYIRIIRMSCLFRMSGYSWLLSDVLFSRISHCSWISGYRRFLLDAPFLPNVLSFLHVEVPLNLYILWSAP